MRALRWASPVVLAVELALVLTGSLSLGRAVLAFVAVEAALALLCLRLTAVAVRAYRAARRDGTDPEPALEAATRAVLPDPIASLVLHEGRLVHSLLLWARGRQHGVPPGAVAIAYGRDDRAVGLALLTVSLVELVVVELVIPWPTVRLVLFLLGVYGVVVVLGFIAGPVVRPHVLTEDSLRLRVGTWADVTLPLDAITEVARRRGNADGLVTFVDSTLVLAVGNQTQLDLGLDRPQQVRAGRRSGTVHSVRVSADDAGAAAIAIRTAVLARIDTPLTE